MARARLTDEERNARRRARWPSILNQRRPYAVPTVDEVVDDFRRRFGAFGENGTADDGPVSTETARRYFNLSVDFTRDDLRRAFRARISLVHPDHGGDAAAARYCVTLYEQLKETP